jgi:hypothetical protein
MRWLRLLGKSIAVNVYHIDAKGLLLLINWGPGCPLL